MSSRDYYHILGVARTASQEQIRRAFRELARRHHPDVSDAPDADKHFAQIQQAYETLSDPQRRRAYDRTGSSAHSRSMPDGFDADDMGSIFDTFFGPRSRGRPGPRPPLRHEVLIPFELAARGGSQDLRLRVGQRDHELTITIPPATEDGARLRVRKTRGLDRDVIVTVRVGAHPQFRRVPGRALDLECELAVSIFEAALGARIALDTLDERVDLVLPEGTPSGRRLRLRDRGLIGKDGSRGDLLVDVRIVPPPQGSLTDNDREALVGVAQRHKGPREGATRPGGHAPS